MRLNPTTIAAMVAVAIVTAGCSNGTSSSDGSTGESTAPSSQSSTTPSTTAPSTPASAPQGGPLDQSTCLDISFTKDNLMVANTAENARKYADKLEKYGPPDPVKAAIEHFVTTGGARPNDPDLNANRDLITGWIKQICPNVNP